MTDATGEMVIANAAIRVAVTPGRGAEIRFVGHPDGENVLADYDWSTPVPASRSTSYGSAELDWMSEYRGGWQELLPNAGDACVVEGVPVAFHGEASASAWDVVEHAAASVTLRVGTRLPLVVERRMRVVPDAATLVVEETVTNHGDVDVDFLWGHHPAFDALPGLRIDLPPGPVHGSGMPDITEEPAEGLTYLPDRPAHWAALRHPDSGRGVALAWDGATFPHLWVWHTICGAGWPWYGRARIVAIEPQSAWPRDGLAAAIARGRSLRLGPSQSRDAWLTLSLFEASERAVTGVDRDGAVHQEGESDVQ